MNEWIDRPAKRKQYCRKTIEQRNEWIGKLGKAYLSSNLVKWQIIEFFISEHEPVFLPGCLWVVYCICSNQLRSQKICPCRHADAGKLKNTKKNYLLKGTAALVSGTV